MLNSYLKLFLGKLCSRWSGPFKGLKVFPQEVVEGWSETFGAFKLNGQRLKHYITSDPIKEKVVYTYSIPSSRGNVLRSS